MEKKKYLKDPCGASSLSFWKTNSITIPDDLLILREDDPRLDELRQLYSDMPYFKLIHRMVKIERPALPVGFRFIYPDESVLCDHIAVCYLAERASASKLAECRLRSTYAPDLWLAVMNEDTDEIVASGIAELDRDIGEGILEWVQVSPAYRRKGFGSLIVCELLHRLRDRADFVTVSGKEGDCSNPRALYERCGFEAGVIWHVLNKNR